MGNWPGLGGVVASRRIAMVATMATVTILIAAECGPEQPPPGGGRPTGCRRGGRHRRLRQGGRRGDRQASRGHRRRHGAHLGRQRLPRGLGRKLRGVLRALLGPVQESHQARPWQPRVRNRRVLSILRLLRESGWRSRRRVLLLRPGKLAPSRPQQQLWRGRDPLRSRLPQGFWLKADLAANDEEACTLAYFHHPLFTSGSYRPGIERVERL